MAPHPAQRVPAGRSCWSPSASARAILAEAALSFLGVGVQEPDAVARPDDQPSRRPYFSTAPHLLFFPGLAIVLTVLGFLLVGDGLRDALDVKDA